MLSDNVRS
ncbi:unnamed protein product [Rhodiola kirilowii]